MKIVCRIQAEWQFEISPCADEKLSDQTFEVFYHECKPFEE